MDEFEDLAEDRPNKIEAIARDVDRLVSNGFLGRGLSWMKAWYEFQIEWSDEADDLLTIPLKYLTPLIELAKSDGEVFELAMYVVGTRLHHSSTEPDQLDAFIAQFLMGEFPKPKKKKGPPRATGRDFIITHTMRQLVDDDELLPTANRITRDSKDRESSASELLIQALAKTELGHMDIGNIHRIWHSKDARADYSFINDSRLKNLFDDADDLPESQPSK